jgi:hypothetical protein
MVNKEDHLSFIFFSYKHWFFSFLGLLKILSQVLNNRSSSIALPLSVTSSALSLSLMPSVLESQNISNIVLALRTLGSFNFEG